MRARTDEIDEAEESDYVIVGLGEVGGSGGDAHDRSICNLSRVRKDSAIDESLPTIARTPSDALPAVERRRTR